MTSYQNGGRNSALPDEQRGSWRPQDQPSSHTYGSRGNEDDRDYRSWRDRNHREDENQFTRDPGRWEGSRGSELGYRDEREGYGRTTERYGQGQSGYSAGRYGDDRSQRMQNRNEMISGSYEDRYQGQGQGMGLDERFSRVGSSYGQERGYDPERYGAQGGYGGGRGFEADRRDRDYGRDERMGYSSYRSNAPNQQHMGYEREQGWSPSTNYGQGAARNEQRTRDADSHAHRGSGPHRGKGPVGYKRSDERLREMICESLADDDQLDASNIEVIVKNGEVTLSGTVDDRRSKRDAEDCACSVSGVRDIQNLLRVKDDRQAGSTGHASGAIGSSTSSTNKIETEASSQNKKHQA